MSQTAKNKKPKILLLFNFDAQGEKDRKFCHHRSIETFKL